MKILRKIRSITHKSQKSCVVTEFPLKDTDINAAIVKLSGRYPEKGRAVNSVSKELAYIMSGSGYIVAEGRKTTLNKGDLIMISPGERYFLNGRLALFISNTPAWHLGQYKMVD